MTAEEKNGSHGTIISNYDYTFLLSFTSRPLALQTQTERRDCKSEKKGR